MLPHKWQQKNNMSIHEHLKELGFTQYEIDCYLALVNHHPVNGSQLSRASGVSRSKIYDVLRNMSQKGLVAELEGGLFAPLPPEELMKRLRGRFETSMSVFARHLKNSTAKSSYDYVWTIRGYHEVMAKASQMVASAREEIYIRLHPVEGRLMDTDLRLAFSRGISVKYVSLGPAPSSFPLQVVHPEAEKLYVQLGGRPIDLVVDKREALAGMFEASDEDNSAINWTRNRWFVVSSRDSLRHDFYHYFLYKIYEQKKPLSEAERRIYEIIKSDS